MCDAWPYLHVGVVHPHRLIGVFQVFKNMKFPCCFCFVFPYLSLYLNHQEYMLLTSWYSTSWFLHDTCQSSAQESRAFSTHGSISWYLIMQDRCNMMFATNDVTVQLEKTPRRSIEPLIKLWRTTAKARTEALPCKLVAGSLRGWSFQSGVKTHHKMHLLKRKFHAMLPCCLKSLWPTCFPRTPASTICFKSGSILPPWSTTKRMNPWQKFAIAKSQANNANPTNLSSWKHMDCESYKAHSSTIVMDTFRAATTCPIFPTWLAVLLGTTIWMKIFERTSRLSQLHVGQLWFL